jgi:hypothetical protein
MLFSAPGLAWAQGKPAHQFVPASGTYIADAFALRGDGAELAYFTTTGTRKVVLHLVDLGAPGQHREIAGVPGAVESILWLGPGRILVVTRSGPRQRLMGTAFTRAGPESPTVGPADHIALGTFEGKPVVTAYREPAGKTGKHHLAAFDVATLHPLASRDIELDGHRQLEVGGQKLKLLWWGDDFTVVAVRHPGEYDQVRDLRLPDRFGRVDLLTNKIVDDAAIDPAGFARLASLKRLYPGKSAFVHLDPRSGKLLLIDGIRSHVLEPARPLATYDLAAIGFQKISPDEAMVSLTLDPFRREATVGGRRGRGDLEFYSVDPRTGASRLRLTLDSENRPSTWQVGGDGLALLRKHRGFARGGVVLQVYSLRGGGLGRP